jgi:hypothetical protein
VLTSEYGLDLTGWQLLAATGISDDGSTITGYGSNPAGMMDSWIARLPVPPAIADFDTDNNVDYYDFTSFSNCLTGPNVPYDPQNLPAYCTQTPDLLGLIPADFDWDGDVDQADFGVFQRCFSGWGAPPPDSCRG